jgi:uncharacterized membrane protein
MHTTDRPRRRALLTLLLAVLLAAAFAAAPASAANEAAQGGQLLQRVQAGTTTCKSLSTTDSDHIGEYVMERMLGSAGVHQAMNRQMAAMMGARGETQAHVYMGQRFAGCATGNVPNSFGTMMGMVGAGLMGSVYGSGGGTPGMIGSNARNGGMMGFGYGTPTTSGDGWSSGDTAMVVMMGLLLALVAGALFAWRPWRRTDQTPLSMLQSRFARGDIDQHEYDARRDALGGTA